MPHTQLDDPVVSEADSAVVPLAGGQLLRGREAALAAETLGVAQATVNREASFREGVADQGLRRDPFAAVQPDGVHPEREPGQG